MLNWRRKPVWFLTKCATLLFLLLATRELIAILNQYRWYFPPDFRAAHFLVGRREIFHGLYKFAFYAHILCGPIAILIGTFLFWSGSQNYRIGLHRVLGKIQFLLVIVLAPSGLAMSLHAYTGLHAGIGFATLAVLTLVTLVLSLKHVRRGELPAHQLWSTRLLILLLSPLLLRMISGSAVLLGIVSSVSYQFAAWASWLLPLIVFELARDKRPDAPTSLIRNQTQSESVRTSTCLVQTVERSHE